MKKFIISIFILGTLLEAAPAFQAKRTFTQPDGTVVEYRNKGDEHLHWKETKSGDILLYNNQSDQLEYAKIKDGNLKPSGSSYHKSNKMKRSAVRHLSKKDLESLYTLKRKKHSKRMQKHHTQH